MCIRDSCRTYDSWGVPVSREGSMKDTLGLLNPFRYREYVYDDESGLYYLQTRYYDPRVGRFINADIMMASNGDFPSCSVFSYCSNDPVNGSDPSGMSEFQANYMREARAKEPVSYTHLFVITEFEGKN